jgi:uncharacterized Zn finger protein (UPF0148 family)
MKICPKCGTVVEVEGRTTHYYWCPTCKKPVDPIEEEQTLKEADKMDIDKIVHWLRTETEVYASIGWNGSIVIDGTFTQEELKKLAMMIEE